MKQRYTLPVWFAYGRITQQLLFFIYITHKLSNPNSNTTHLTTTLAYHITNSIFFFSTYTFHIASVKTKMASISMAINPKCKEHGYGEGNGDWFGYTCVSCIEEDYRNGDRDSCKEGDDDDDGGYDYAPAA
jgi:hypothetical protein